MTDDQGTKRILLRIAAELAAARAQRHLLACGCLLALAAIYRDAAFFAIITAAPMGLLAISATKDAKRFHREADAGE
jgi:hypothetical protein